MFGQPQQNLGIKPAALHILTPHSNAPQELTRCEVSHLPDPDELLALVGISLSVWQRRQIMRLHLQAPIEMVPAEDLKVPGSIPGLSSFLCLPHA